MSCTLNRSSSDLKLLTSTKIASQYQCFTFKSSYFLKKVTTSRDTKFGGNISVCSYNCYQCHLNHQQQSHLSFEQHLQHYNILVNMLNLIETGILHIDKMVFQMALKYAHYHGVIPSLQGSCPDLLPQPVCLSIWSGALNHSQTNVFFTAVYSYLHSRTALSVTWTINSLECQQSCCLRHKSTLE